MQHATFHFPCVYAGNHEKQLWLTSVKSAKKSVIGVENYTTYKHHISARHTTSAPPYTQKLHFLHRAPSEPTVSGFFTCIQPYGSGMPSL